MKPSAFRIERLLAEVEAEVERRGLRARRYAFHPDEVAEAKRRLALRARAQGFEQSGMDGAVWRAAPPPIQVINDRPGRGVSDVGKASGGGNSPP
jgi:hypothetical protein